MSLKSESIQGQNKVLRTGLIPYTKIDIKNLILFDLTNIVTKTFVKSPNDSSSSNFLLKIILSTAIETFFRFHLSTTSVTIKGNYFWLKVFFGIFNQSFISTQTWRVIATHWRKNIVVASRLRKAELLWRGRVWSLDFFMR